MRTFTLLCLYRNNNAADAAFYVLIVMLHEKQSYPHWVFFVIYKTYHLCLAAEMSSANTFKLLVFVFYTSFLFKRVIDIKIYTPWSRLCNIIVFAGCLVVAQ